MTSSTQLETYLSTLDKTLGPISVSERAEIITEIKSHVMEAQQRDSSQTLQSILASLGEPEQVASKYLMERGLKPAKPAKRPIVKWLTIGFLGSLGIFLIFVLVLVFKFTPLIEVNDEKGRVKILGGLIDVSDSDKITLGGTTIDQSSHRGSINITGSTDVSKNVLVSFTNGKFEILNSEDNRFYYDCKVDRDSQRPDFVKRMNDHTIFDLSKTVGSQCTLRIPKKSLLEMQGGNAKINLEKPAFNVDLKFANSKVEMIPDKSLLYNYDIKMTNGKIGKFHSSDAKEALKVRVTAANGVISFD